MVSNGGRQSAAARRAERFVERTDTALADLSNAEAAWTAGIGSRSDEVRLHVMSTALDTAIRRVEGHHEAWDTLTPASVEQVAERAPMPVFWMVSAHPSGQVRHEAVRHMARYHSDQIMPHLANRAVDFVPAIRASATLLLRERLAAVAAERTGPGPHGVLPTATHIAIEKLLAPRTARLSPELVRPCLELAETASMSRPRLRTRGGGHGDTLEPFRQAYTDATAPEHRDALELMIAYLAEETDHP
ncbi:MAG: hypothetical protein AAGA65_11360 [Actinomycetota bacterium]